MKNILVVGANCAWQKVLIFNNFTENKINRAQEIYKFASGKGINFSRAMKIYGKCEPYLIQFSGGDTGEKILKNLTMENIEYYNINVAGDTRVCTTCLSLVDNETTEIIEPSPAASPVETNEFLTACQKVLSTNQCAGVAICGTLINGVSTDLYFDIVKTALNNNKIVLLDTFRNMEKVFKSKSDLIILKINRDELTELTGNTDAKSAMESLKIIYNFKAIMITDGAEKSYLIDDKMAFYEFELPLLDKLVNPIGSGDTASAVLLSEYLSTGDIINSCKIALGAASANCRSIKCGEFDVDYAKNYAEKVRVYAKQQTF